jgi:4,5-dihydroxyphthalate decarboxylase
MLDVSLGISDTPRARAVIDGRVGVEGVRLLTSIVPPSELFWRQLRFAEFDVSEMSLSSLAISISHGDLRWVAIPVFTVRRFFHTRLLVHVDSGIETPKDLIGRKVGVPEYQQTAAVWSRGALENEFGVRSSDIEWFMERGPDRSHAAATSFEPPKGVVVHQIPPTESIGGMLGKGTLDATLLYITSQNLVDRSNADLSKVARPLFPDAATEGLRYFRSTGLYPVNHTVVVRRSLLERHPWLALNLYKAFSAASTLLRNASEAWINTAVETGQVDPGTASTLKQDFAPYGVRSARKELETLTGYLQQQGLTKEIVKLEDMFAPSVMEL